MERLIKEFTPYQLNRACQLYHAVTGLQLLERWKAVKKSHLSFDEQNEATKEIIHVFTGSTNLFVRGTNRIVFSLYCDLRDAGEGKLAQEIVDNLTQRKEVA